AFGSNALQAKLTAISNQAKHLQRMQRGGQALLLLCALGLLIAAFWLRGQQRQVSAMDAA
ncbi:MAG: hypothetical protein L0H70_06205, partial [Xanthomonadales bacterium]|nr:hypothetical protein [Xanthomonadales bacterium]